MLRLGFTGTRRGLTKQQQSELHWRFQCLSDVVETRLHYGCCIGADYEAAEIASSFGWFLEGHPPENKKAFRPHPATTVFWPDKPYLVRNQDIVDNCDLLVACPAEKQEILRSGTWATIRRAYKSSKPVLIVYPDGSTLLESLSGLQHMIVGVLMRETAIH